MTLVIVSAVPARTMMSGAKSLYFATKALWSACLKS